MVKNPEILQKFEDDYIRNNNQTLEKKFKTYDELRNYAIALGQFPLKDPLEGIEEKIKFVRKLHFGYKSNR
jgi:hypothetical protein